MSFELFHGDCLDVLRGMPDCSVDSIVTDPPYGLSNTSPAQVADALKAWVSGDVNTVPAKRGGFMGKDWDSFVPPPAVWVECLRVLKPGGHMLVFAGARTQDLMGLSIRLAGFEIRDTLGWVYGCLSEDTEVLINGEWVQYHKAKVGDLALCYNKEHDTYEWQPIEDTHKYKYGDTAYRIRSDNTDQIVSRNHRVLVERGGAYEFEYAENLARERQIRVPVLENVRALLDDLSVREPLPSGEEPVLQRELRNVRPSTGCGEADGGTRNDGDCVCRVREEGVQAERLVEADENADVLTRMQREVARGEVEGARTQGSSGVVGGNESAVRGKSAWREEPCLERRGDVETRPRELQGCPVCEVPAGVPEHVSEGWVRDGAPPSRGEGNREAAAADGDCASCESQSGGQPAGEPLSVCVESGSQAVRGARYTVADLAEIEPVRYEGVVWCLTVPTGAFVVRRNGKVFVTGNSGFPKSMDVSKAIDKAAGAEREVVGAKTYPDGNTHIDSWPGGANGHEGWQRPGAPAGDSRDSRNVTAPATPEAKRWDGWGTALKPAIEPIILARKPLDGTVAANVLAHGVGGLNIDACRVPTGEDTGRAQGTDIKGGNFVHGTVKSDYVSQAHAAGRFPANVLLDEHAAAEMDEQSGWLKSGAVKAHHKRSTVGGNGRTHGTMEGVTGPLSEANEGGASRFFPVFKYQAKAPKRERPVIYYNECECDQWQSQPKATTVSTSMGERSWSTSTYGSNTTGQSQKATTFTTSTTTNSIIGSRTCGASAGSSTNVSTQGASCATESGGSPAECVESSSLSVGTTGISAPKGGPSMEDAGSVTSPRWYTTSECESCGEQRRRVAHCTVKPLALMSWLVTLITPPGGVVLDPFAGSGATVEAARNSGFRPIAIEQDAEYCDLIRERMRSK